MHEEEELGSRNFNALGNKMKRIKQMVCSLIHSMKEQKSGHWCHIYSIKLTYPLCGTEARQHQTTFITTLLNSLALQIWDYCVQNCLLKLSLIIFPEIRNNFGSPGSPIPSQGLEMFLSLVLSTLWLSAGVEPTPKL